MVIYRPFYSGFSLLHHFSYGSTEKQEQVVQTSLFSRNGIKFHPGVGCDYCGVTSFSCTSIYKDFAKYIVLSKLSYGFFSQMCPIIGLRYRCKDCVEDIGFDLCEGCYNSPSKLPGRFNQQHTKDHQFQVTPPFRELVGAEYAYGNDGNPNNDIRIIYLTNDDSDGEMSVPLESPTEEPRDLENATRPPESSNLENATRPPDSSNDHSEDQSSL